MEQDFIDRVIKQWRSERPDLDAQAIAVVSRILRLAGHLERRANEALKSFDLPIWGFDVLATLRRHGAPYSMTPTELLRSTTLTSGAMTNRIDRLEELGLVAREADPDDRRSLRVKLTPSGLALIDQTTPVRFAEAKDALRGISRAEEKALADLLRKLLLTLEKQST